MVTTRPPKTIVKPTALGPVANTDTKLLIYGLFQKGRVLAQDAVRSATVPTVFLSMSMVAMRRLANNPRRRLMSELRIIIRNSNTQ